MIDELKQEYASLYALGLLEGADKTTFEAELTSDPELRKLVDALRQTSASLALTTPQLPVPARLRNRVLASIDAANASARSRALVGSPASSPTAQVVRFPLTAWIGWAVAACFAILASYVSVRYMSMRAEVTLQRHTIELTQLDLRSLQQQLEANQILSGKRIADLEKAGDLAQLKIAKLASLTGNSPEAVAIAVWNPLSQAGILTVDSLPRIQQDQDYQLWVVDPRYKDPVNGGVFTVDDRGTARLNFHPDQPVTAATQFAISRERKGGVPKAEGPIVAAGAL